MKKIILTGGGTAGHVTPNLALLPELYNRGYSVSYIGSKTGIERDLITEAGVPYHGISSGKLRRYFSLQNFTDPSVSWPDLLKHGLFCEKNNRMWSFPKAALSLFR